ncbi:MAG: hypothetical protein GVY22_17000 [Gammaproteobacteria bacterium]|jgi:hypothetical protein|nr:hypothetical protein [Gammaproteobacteria bacterium]
MSNLKARIERLERERSAPKVVFIGRQPTEREREELNQAGLAALLLPDNGRDPELVNCCHDQQPNEGSE